MRWPSGSERRWLLGILVVAALLRLAWALYATKEPISARISGDAFSYYHYGKELAAGHGYLNLADGEATAYYPIGYPALLAGLFWFVRHTPLPDDLPMAASLLNVVLGTATVGLVFVVARRLFDRTVALVGAALVALFPNLIFYTATTQLETAFLFLAAAALAVLVTAPWRAGPLSRNRLLAFGTVLGLAGLVRPFALPFLVGLVLAVLVAGQGWRHAARAAAWTALPLVVLFTPWTLRNVDALGEPIVFSTNMGDTLCLDRSLDATGGFRFAEHDGCVDPLTPEVERNAGNTRKALEFVRDHPGKELSLIPKRAVSMMDNDHDGLLAVEGGTANPFLGARVRGLLTHVADWYFNAVLALGIVGLLALARGRRDRRPERVAVAVAIATLTVVPLLLWGNVRFHLPLSPFLAVLAAATVVWVLRGLRLVDRPDLERDGLAVPPELEVGVPLEDRPDPVLQDEEPLLDELHEPAGTEQRSRVEAPSEG